MSEQSDAHKRLIRSLAERHIPTEDMTALLEQLDGTIIDVDTLEREFAYELRMGRASGHLAIADSLNKAMREGNAAAMIYLSKVHLGWRENESSKTKRPGRPKWPSNGQMATILNIPPRSSRKFSA